MSDQVEDITAAALTALYLQLLFGPPFLDRAWAKFKAKRRARKKPISGN